MSETIKVVIEISKDYYEILKCEVEQNQTDYYPFIVIGNGIPLLEDQPSSEVIERVLDKIAGVPYHFWDSEAVVYLADVISAVESCKKEVSE